MARATTFRGIVELIRRAENALIRQAGQTDPKDRVTTLRGIYYGTEWSLDNRVERSTIRNIGFLTYTGGSVPADPRPALGQQLFNDLQASQTMEDHGWRIDIGHVLIGLDTRASAIMRTIPLTGQGGTGLEIVTWLGDLGGGVANLAYHRVTRPDTSAQRIFHNRGSDYGVSENLEGDIGGYLVACGSSPGGAPLFSNRQALADLLEEYLPIASQRVWTTRVAQFATAIGATITTSGITNAGKLIDTLTPKLYDFAVWYAATRYIPSGQLHGRAVTTACQHMGTAAREVATVFVQALSHAIAHPHEPIAAVGPYPKPSHPGQCESRLLDAASRDVSTLRREYDDIRKGLQRLFE